MLIGYMHVTKGEQSLDLQPEDIRAWRAMSKGLCRFSAPLLLRPPFQPAEMEALDLMGLPCWATPADGGHR